MTKVNQLKWLIVTLLLNIAYPVELLLEYPREDTVPLLLGHGVTNKPKLNPWRHRRHGRLHRWPTFPEREATAVLETKTLAKGPVKLTENEIQKIDYSLADHYWKIPKKWNPKHLDEKNGMRWLQAYLYEPKANLQRAWLIAAKDDSGNPRYSHPLEEIPILQKMLECNMRGKESDRIEITHLINYFFFKISNDMDLSRKKKTRKDEVLQDALIVNFIATLATLTAVYERREDRVSSLQTEIKRIVEGHLPAFQKKAALCGRFDMVNLVKVLKKLWERELQYHSE